MAKTTIGLNNRTRAKLADRLEEGITDGARELAQKEGVMLRNLKGKGSGEDGKIIKKDVRRAVKERDQEDEDVEE